MKNCISKILDVFAKVIVGIVAIAFFVVVIYCFCGLSVMTFQALISIFGIFRLVMVGIVLALLAWAIHRIYKSGGV